ncbi:MULTISPECIES: glucose-1-phosphate cytidylyltransferase [Acidobacterium]|uniref:Glucose-1-phosphate cytidylyltransferase n=1 Tax=Acidobacterium capsulatum (strain ATCC 51196 / DSM 11244 / BCRC 80197 / JCM 7670 / NBRC 15755 / NCIMB 13165 / 161) TaxID=240015 RepID=C1F1I0_ACIC5|nr:MULTISPECIES: glucose-1-phosphate cytidylyltransferase [Acidobacterium]ACO32002.1 glucose-1-phosphate cytidylyltransferase [Acidobacterium capsulatum ATCC 51196]HCT61895.1 glucose-1-phosphate cytidylyltransferase [Acidobacterium sp.]
MKAVILAGGLGSRLSEETTMRPKPMVEVGGRPILWHILKIYSAFGINDFIVCLGYKGYCIKEYFANYALHAADITIDIKKNEIRQHRTDCEDWKITLVDTGAETQTGGRLRRVLPYLEGEETFCFTYGDGVANINIDELLAFHRRQQRLVTLTAVQPNGKYGSLLLDADDSVQEFTEKPRGDGHWINGGFFVLSPKVKEYLEGDGTIWERGPLESLSRDGQVSAYRHRGFWQSMDTIHDRNLLDSLWRQGSAPWKVW